MSRIAPTSPSSPPPAGECFLNDNPLFAGTSSQRPSSGTMDDGMIIVPMTGTETPNTRAKMPGISGCTSPEVHLKIESASPDTAKVLALRLYGSLRRHGLRDEAEKAFHVEEGSPEEAETASEKRKKQEELMGMEYLLKDGFVNYLTNVARITPPIPLQVVRFSGIKYSQKVKIPISESFDKKYATQTQTQMTLNGIDGYIMPGSMTLVLGPPGSGKSTLLEILAGRVEKKNDPGLEGAVLYNDKSVSEIRLGRLIAYVSGQLNKHLPYLTVRETLEFARDCTQGLRPENFTPQMRKFFAHALVEGQDPFLEFIIEILGLKAIENKPASPAISDMDRQKLTIAELALGTYSVMVYDQPLSGSDPDATYDLVDTIRTICRIQQSSAVMALNQLSQEVFDLFDRVILLGQGHIYYQGPRQDAIHYFAQLGYMKPSHVESGEFLEDIVAGKGTQYQLPGSVALTVDELVEWYQCSDQCQDILRIIGREEVRPVHWIESEPGIALALKTPPGRQELELVVAKLPSKSRKSAQSDSTGEVQVGDVVTGISIGGEQLQYLAVGERSGQQQDANEVCSMLKNARGHIRLQIERCKGEEDEPQTQWEQFQRPFVQTWWGSTKTLILRQIKITRQLHLELKLKLFQACILGLFAGGLFHKLAADYTWNHMNSVRALGFVAAMSVLMLNMVQLNLYLHQRPVFYKQKAQRFFRVSSYVFAQCVLNIPTSFVEAFLYSVLMYFIAGLTLANHGLVFAEFVLLMFLVNYLGSSVFFLISTISIIPEIGGALALLVISITLYFSGFMIYPSNIPKYWKWMMYLNPIRWVNVSFCDFQFSDLYTKQCSGYLDALPYCVTTPNMTVGKAYILFNELDVGTLKRWVPYLVLIGWSLFLNLLTWLSLYKIEFQGTSQSLPELKERRVATGDTNNDSLEFSIVMSESGIKPAAGSKSVAPEEFRLEWEPEKLSIPVLPVTLLFTALSFRIRSAEGSKGKGAVFDHVSGYTKPSTMLALIGGNKARITTLLKCLAGRVPPTGTVTGELLANGCKPSIAFSRASGYVERLDAHQPYLSVRESLQFSAGLRLGPEIDSMMRNNHLELILDQLGLRPFANHLVGSLRDATGKTFEIAKKLTIAVELAANPSILFLEDPIAGLDAIGASEILLNLSIISASGRIVVATINHPNTRALSHFSEALILTQDGRQAYFGPVGFNCGELLNYFTSFPQVPQYLHTHNPVSFIMGAMGMGIKNRGGCPVMDFAEAYQFSNLFETNNRAISSLIPATDPEKELGSAESEYPTSYAKQAAIVLMRTQRYLWRNRKYTSTRLIWVILIGLLMGSLYFQIKYVELHGFTSRALYIYMQCILIGCVTAINVIPQISTDRLVYFREGRAKMYLPIFYPLSWMIGEIPYIVVLTMAMTAIGNGMAGLATQTVSDFLLYWLSVFLFALCMTYFGAMLTFLAPKPILAAFTNAIMLSMWVSSSGVVVVFHDIRFFSWMFWTNPFQYAIAAMSTISFYCDTSKCATTGCSCPQLNGVGGQYAWDRIAAVRSLKYGHLGWSVAALWWISLAFAAVAITSFTMLKHNKPPVG